MEKEKYEIPEIIIDEQFKALLPALDEQTYALLEESLLNNGCLHPLVVWNGILIDGHNRYEICQKHEIPFATVEKEFESRDEALIWIITTQVARRNLTPIQLSYYRGLHYRADKQIVSNKTGINRQKLVEAQNGLQPKQSTSERLAGEYNVSKNTIKRDAQLAEAIEAIGESSPEAKREILSGTANISRTRLQELAASGTEDEIKSIAESLEQGTYEKPKKSSDDVFRSILAALNGAIAKMAEAYTAQMQTSSADEAAQMKTALRGHIKKLEDLYRLF
jgi:ParB-like chromosome segregation protein Spo0J